MGKRAERKRKAKEFSDDAVAGVRTGAHRAVDTAEEFFGKSKRKTKKARRRVDDAADKAEKKLRRIAGKAEKKAARIRNKSEHRIDKATDKLPD